MRTRVEFFESNTIFSLEKQINEFLKTLHWSSQVDVKYNHLSSHLPQDNDDDWNVLYTAMVMYEPHGEEDSVPEGGAAQRAPQRKGTIIQDNQQGADPV